MSFQGCMIDDIPDSLFSSLSALRVLELGGNILTSIEKDDFRDLHGLTFLDLSSNRITHISPHAFNDMKALETLDISNNKLHSLLLPGLGGVAPSSRLLPKISQIILDNNPWHCKCELGPLYQDMMSRGLSPGEAQCHGDKKVPWSQLPPENFTCAPNILTFTPNQFVRLGDDLTLECRFESNPAPSFIFWSLNGINLPEDNFTFTHSNHLLMTQTKTRLKLFNINEGDLGEYQCHATNSEESTSASVRIFLERVLPTGQDYVGLIVGLVVSSLVLVGFIALAVFCCRRRRRKICGVKDDDDSSVHNESSYAILDTSNSLPAMRKEGSDINWTNPLPKPPRTGVYSVMSVIESSTLGRKPKMNVDIDGIVPNDRNRFISHYVSNQHLAIAPIYQSPIEMRRADPLEQMELLNWVPSRPGSRASIGTASTLLSHPSELHSQSFNFPAPTRTATHPPQSRPGYVTLPRRPRSRPLTPSTSTSIPLEPLGPLPGIPQEPLGPTPTIAVEPLGPRTMGDGSSFHNIATVQSPAMDRLALPQLVNNNNVIVGKDEGSFILNKSQEMSEADESLPNLSFTRSEDSPPSRPILDTIPEQD